MLAGLPHLTSPMFHVSSVIFHLSFNKGFVIM